MQKIGSKVFVVHKDYAGKGKTGGVVRPATITGIKNVNGKVVYLLKVFGIKPEVDTNTYEVFNSCEDAINAIQSE